MLKVKLAQQKLIDAISCAYEQDDVQLINALGRVTTNEIRSSIFVPPTDNSSMDGFAVKASDVTDKALTISQRITAGYQPKALSAGSAARIFTGGVIPEGANAIVIQENCQYSANSDEVTINCKVSPGDNIRPKGQDISKGDIVVSKGKKLSPVDLGLLASIGQATVSVYRPIKIAIFSTGDELVEPGKTLGAGQIYNSNRSLLTSLCQQKGYQMIDCGIVEDTLEATKIALKSAATKADIVISCGGVSVGEEDHVKPAVEALGSLDLWKVQMKPGKPVAFGKIMDVPFLGLPGNPVSAFIVFQLLALPVLARLQGEDFISPTSYQVLADFDKASVSREEYIRVSLEKNKLGQLKAKQFNNQSSGVLMSLSRSDGLIRQKIDQQITAGSLVEFLPLHHGSL